MRSAERPTRRRRSGPTAFLPPRSSVVTSPFGTGRVFNGAVTSRHLGIDFRGAVGDTIKAANRGVVALVDTFFLAGTVVYIDHGAGVVTGYFHMSKPLVVKGDTVARGQVIGLVGQTGRVTGPHTHWSARYGAITVNPGDLLTLDPAWYPGEGRLRDADLSVQLASSFYVGYAGLRKSTVSRDELIVLVLFGARGERVSPATTRKTKTRYFLPWTSALPRVFRVIMGRHQPTSPPTLSGLERPSACHAKHW